MNLWNTSLELRQRRRSHGRCRSAGGRGQDSRSQGPLRLGLALLAFSVLGASGCSVRKFAVNKLGDSLASGGTSFASDDDPDLVGEALPFSLKLMEGLLEESPRHRGLLFAASSGFTQYAYVFVQQPAEQIEDKDLGEADALRARARRLYLRARNYGLRGLETRYPDFATRLRQEPKSAVRKTLVRDVPLLYWTATSWGAAIALSKDNPEMVADQLIVEALIDRAFALDPDYDHGAIDEFLITYESVRVGATKDFASRSRKHFDRALNLTSHQSASPYVALAEVVSISNQDREEFESLLKKALAIDPDARPEWRLSNIVMQRRARWLLSREDDLFVK